MSILKLSITQFVMDICLREEVVLTVYVIDALDLAKVGVIQTRRDVYLWPASPLWRSHDGL